MIVRPLLLASALLGLAVESRAQEDPRAAAVRAWALDEHESAVPAGWSVTEQEILFRLLGEGSRPDSAFQLRVLQGLESLRPRRLEPWVAERVSPGAPEAERIAALRVLAHVGGPQSVPLCARLASEGPRARVLGDELRHALAGLLRRRPETFERLWVLFEETPGDLRRFAFEAVGDVPARSALSDLADWLDRARDQRPTVLRSIARVAAASPAPHGAELRERVREFLDDDAPAVRAAAALAAGALEDAQACEALITLLEDERAAVRHAALDGLRAIARHPFRGDPDRWRSWYATESRWWGERSEAVFETLRTGSPTALIGAIGELVSHSLDRHRLAAELLGALEDDSSQVRRLAALGLGQLGSALAIQALTLATQDEDASVRAAAEQALVRCSPPSR